jgi:glycosyltransferase involved in cell wall biosynthesis
MVTPSRWLAERVKASNILGGFPLSVIPYGLDIEDFAPRDRRAARNVLGIPQEAKVVLFVADVTDNMRKGFALLAEALIRCSNKVANLFLVSLGHNKPAVHIQTPWLHVGPINNDRFLSMVYSAADIFTIPSLQDNLPNTVLEAMACGTPVVGFAVGGVPDMIREGVNGLLVSASNVPALHVAMVNLLNNAGREDIRANCRRVAVEEYSLELQARQYSELYKALI